MALVTPDDGSDTPRVFGSVAGAIVRTASARGPRLRQGYGELRRASDSLEPP